MRIKVKGKDLCCLVNRNEVKCHYCKSDFCMTCGKAFGVANHFILNMCRKRLYAWEITWALSCYRNRVIINPDGIRQRFKVKGYGDCIVCAITKQLRIDDRSDRQTLDMAKQIWLVRSSHKEWIRRADEKLR